MVVTAFVKTRLWRKFIYFSTKSTPTRTVVSTSNPMNHIRQVLLSARRPARPTSLALLRCRRTFSYTPRLQASENEDAFLSQFKNTSIFSKLADKPEALMALRDFAELMRAQGRPRVIWSFIHVHTFCFQELTQTLRLRRFR
jgi:hypothetical protein